MKRRFRLLSSSQGGSKEFQKFFSSLKIGHDEYFVSNQGKQKIKSNKLVCHLSEILQELDHSQSDILWKNVDQLCTKSLRDFASCVDQEHGNINEEDLAQITEVLKNIAFLCSAAIQFEDAYISEGLLGVVLILHGSLLSFTTTAASLASAVCKLCTVWWSKDLVNKNNLCLNALIYMLSEILGSGLTAEAKPSATTNAKELYQLQNALLNFLTEAASPNESTIDTVTMESTQELRQLLISAYLHPVFLKSRKGQKFLSNTLLLNESLMKAIHQVIMGNVLAHRKFAKEYGDIYYMAWTLADEETKEKLEDICIQDSMFRAIHTTREKDLFQALHSLISSITSHSGSLQVRHMLTRSYNPIIWRSLKASNALVRVNAASLFFDAFPLMSPDLNSEERDALLQRQFTAIDELIMDPVPQIRSIAILGLCKILNLFWDVIPAHVIAVQTRNLFTNMAFDSSSIAVRVAVFKGTIILLGNPCSHPLLKKLLPLIGQCLHDYSEKVRIEVCNVLLAVKQTATIQYWDVCPIESILPQLEMENPSGTKRLVKLLSGSFLPFGQSTQTWVERCINFFKRNATAARKFYLYAKDQLTAMEAGEFMYLISVFIFNQVSKSLEDHQEENDGPSDNSSSVAEDSGLIAGLLETICILWYEFSKKMKSDSSDNAARESHGGPNSLRELTKRIMIQLPRTAHVCFRKYHDERSLNVLLHLSSCLHPASMPIFSKNVISKLKSLPEEATRPYYRMLIQCTIKWGWSNKVLQLINDWLVAGVIDNQANATSEVPVDQEPPTDEVPAKRRSVKGAATKRKKPRGKTVQFTVAKAEPRVGQALKYMSCLLGTEEEWSSITSDETNAKILEEISKCLQVCLTELMSRLHGDAPSRPTLTDQMLVDSLDLYFKLLRRMQLADMKLQADTIDDESCSVWLQRLQLLLERMEADVVDQLKLSSHAMEDPNSSILSTTQAMPLNRNVLTRLALVRNTLNVAFPNIVTLLEVGLPVADHALRFLEAFTTAGVKTVNNAGYVCALFHQLVEWNILYVWSKNSQEDPSDQEASTLVVREIDYLLPPEWLTVCFLAQSKESLAQIFDDILLATMMYSRSNPDGFHRLFRAEVRPHLRSCISSLFQLSSSLTKHIHHVMVRKLVSAVLADIAHHTTAISECRTRDKIADLPQFCACFLTLVTSTECDYICCYTLPEIFANTSIPDEDKKVATAMKACVILLKVLTKDGKNPTAARKCLQKLQTREDFMQLTEKMNESLLL